MSTTDIIRQTFGHCTKLPRSLLSSGKFTTNAVVAITPADKPVRDPTSVVEFRRVDEINGPRKYMRIVGKYQETELQVWPVQPASLRK